MFKHVLAALAAACLLLIVLWAFGAAVPIPKPIGWAVLLAIGIWSAWPLIRHIRGRIIAFLGLGFLALSLSACAALGGGAGGQGFAHIIEMIATDPKCGHDDSIQFVAGVLSGSAARHCPIPAAPLAVGAAVSPTAPASPNTQ